MPDEYEDILGGSSLPVRQDSRSGQWSTLSFTIKSTFILAVLLAVYVVSKRVWDTVLRWREKAYKLSMRRKHGIPDFDHRPFNVAYAAVLRDKQEKEKEARGAERQPGLNRDRRIAAPEQSIRQRPGTQLHADTARANPSNVRYPGPYNPTFSDITAAIPSTSTNQSQHSAHSNRVTFADVYNTSVSAPPQPEQAPAIAGPSRRSGRRSLGILKTSAKHTLDDDELDEADNLKKTRVDGDEFIDGDEDAVWQQGYGSTSPQKRGAKRGFSEEDENDYDDDEDVVASKKMREKRMRKHSLDKAPVQEDEDEEMEVDEDGDEISDLHPVARGKKRDRAEAGSTFGGDEEDVEPEVDAEADTSSSRRRKRRNKRRSDVGDVARGKKRDRDVDEMSEDDSEDGTTRSISRKKRGKKAQSSFDEDEKTSDTSMDDLTTSSKGKGRKIGDVWESNGVTYKVGPNGQRLREALVKKARHKFTMPQDSLHPDRDANLEVYIETWLTEEEYRDAKAQHLLAWQDSPKGSAEPETPLDTPVRTTSVSSHSHRPEHGHSTPQKPSPPHKTGKHLLWDSTSGPSIPVQENPFEAAPSTTKAAFTRNIASNVGLHLSAVPSRRISASKPSPGLADSTNSSPRQYRQFSKWEKQDLEAKAMMKVRDANRKKEEEKDKAEREKKEKERAALPAPSTSAIPSISLSKPAGEAAKPATPSLGFAPPLGGVSGAKGDSSKAASPFSMPGPSTTAPAASKILFPSSMPPPAVPAGTADKDKFQPKPPSSSPFSFPGAGGQSSAPSKPSPLSLGATPSSAAPQQSDKPKLSGFGFPPLNTNSSASTPQNSTTPGATPSSNGNPPARNITFGVTSSTFGAPAGNTEQKSAAAAPPAENKAFGNMGPPQKTATPLVSAFGIKGAAAAAAEPSKPTSAFGANPPAPASTSAPAPAPSAAASGLTFDFGATKKPTTSASPAPAFASGSTTSPSSSLSGALGPPMPSNVNFLFGATPKPAAAAGSSSAPASTTPATTPSTGAPTFKFDTTKDDAAPKPGSAFGSGASAFGSASSGTSAFGAPSSAFGGNKDAPKSAFGVAGSTSSGSGSTPSDNPFGAKDSASKDPFKFGGNTSTSTASKDAPKSMFGGSTFGSTATPGTFGSGGSTFGSTGTAAAGSNGAAPQPTSTFGSSSTFGSGSSAFGGFGAAKPAEGSASSEPPKSAFGGGLPTPVSGTGGFGGFGGASGASTPAFGSGNSMFGGGAKPAGASPFGFPSSGAFGGGGSASTSNSGSQEQSQ